jgi:hypothetical protein
MKASSKRITGFILVIVVAAVVLLLSMLRGRYLRYERAYAALQPKTSKREVIESFGQPVNIQRCRANLSWDGEPLKKDSGECAEEMWYYTRISPEQWVVGLDVSGLVVSKYRFVSP